MKKSNIDSSGYYQIKQTIKPYYRKLRSSVILKGVVLNEVVEFQTAVRCTKEQFTSSKEIKIVIDEVKDRLAYSIINNNSLHSIRKSFYHEDIQPIQILLEDVVNKFIQQYQDVFVPDHLRKFKTLQRSLAIHYNVNEEDVKLDWLNNSSIKEYAHYLLKLGLENTTIKGHLKRYRRIIKYAHDELGVDIRVNSSSLKLKDKQPFIVFMNKKEVDKFRNVKTLTKGEQEVKNRFLYRCYTGIRFSEMPY